MRALFHVSSPLSPSLPPPLPYSLIDPSAPAYDVLLDDFEKGLTSARLDAVFAQVGGGEMGKRVGGAGGWGRGWEQVGCGVGVGVDTSPN